jgi:diguanylate cyclase (GGDEF)-like protein
LTGTGITCGWHTRAGRLAGGLLLSTLLALCPPRSVRAAEETGISQRWEGLAETVFQNYGRAQGLPHPVPTALAQDRDGFLWIGTQGGLSRWDGYRFHSYRADPDQADSLPDDWIETLFVDAGGHLWVGGGAGGLARYDKEQDRFVPLPLKPGAERSHIGALADDGVGGLWIGSDDGLHHLDKAGTLTLVGQAGGLPGGTVRALLRDGRGILWVGTAQGLAWRAADADGFTPVALPEGAAGITALLADDAGRLWVGTRRRGLFVLDRPDGNLVPVVAGPAPPTGSISSLAMAGPDEIWAGLRGGGIWAVDRRSLRIKPIRHDRTLPNSLAHDDVWALLRDDAGSLWVGTTGGLSYHPHDAGLISTIFGAAQRPGSLRETDIMAVLPTRDGRFWLGYPAGGADLVDPDTGLVASLKPDPSQPGQALPPDAVYALAEDDRGIVYFATRRGLYGRDPVSGAVRLIPVPGRDPRASLAAVSFAQGMLWLGGEEDGIWGIIPGTTLDDPPQRVLGPVTLSDPGVGVILRGYGSDLWIGTRDGLNRIDLGSGAIEHIAADPGDPTGLPARFITCMLFDRQGRLWLGTFGGGVAVMEGRDEVGRPRFRRLGLDDGLPHVNVDSLQMDGAGTIWAGTDDGLAMINPQSLAIRPVRRADGATLVDYVAGAGATSAAGEALFGALGGLTVARPGTLPDWQFRPPVVLTDLRVGGVPVPVGRFNGAAHPPPLVLTPQTNNLAVEFAALDFTAPERNLYAYWLEGFDTTWQPADAGRRLAVYSNLAPGDYRLHLRGSNREGRPSTGDLVIPVRVLPDWYQHPWLRLAGLLAGIAAVAGLVRWRTAWLRRRQIVLENQIASRTADLQAANARLERLAMTDPLTGCANRRHFMERAAAILADAQLRGEALSLAVLDLDEFKKINDSHGHPAGDAVLVRTGQLLTSHLRDADLVGRVGGEEFALLMPHTHADGAARLAERLRTTLEQAGVDGDAGRIHATVSVGIAQLQPGEDLDGLYARADAALYRAKQQGRNRVERAG